MSHDAIGTTTAASKCSGGQATNSGNNPDSQHRPQQSQQQQQQHQLPPTPSHQPKQLQATGNVLTMINPDTRTHVVGELYDTERSYVESLQILIEKYMKPLKSTDSSKTLIDSNLVDEIFYTIPEILQHHENFLDALQDRLSSDWDSSQVIGNVFIEAFTNQQIIDTYTKFINNWKNARHAIKVAIQAKPAFERFLEAMSREHRNKLTLDALLIMPVQRIPRYELLIKELIKHTPQDHPDHGPLVEAQKEIHELALKIDRAEKEMLHQEQLRDLEALIENNAGSIQHPHRDFIRYDLVTISTSTLTVTRKERVLFLFCDLLIMTSVKKKVSRRSNLQAAFANSDHDISLLEGNKFKLILRVALDQVEIRCDNNEQTQLWQQQQQQQQIHEQKLLAIAKHKKLIQDKKRELESDLLVLQQMELLSGQLASIDKTNLDVNLAQSIEQTLNQLHNLEFQQSDCENYSNAAQSGVLAQDSYLIQAPIKPQTSAMELTAALQQQSQNSATNISLSQNTFAKEHQQLMNMANEQQDHQQSTTKQSDASLEFIINNDATTRDLSGTNSNTSSRNLEDSVEHNSSSGHNLTSLGPIQDGQMQHCNANCETLVVSFPSRDRRQAFIQAFLDAKQQRLKQQQRRMFSTSMTLKLTQPDQPLMKSRSMASDMRRTRLQHQDEVLDMRHNSSLGKHMDKHNDEHVSSAPCSGTIARCASCSSSYILEPSADPKGVHNHQRHSNNNNNNNNNNHHHHHQLMHQPASHPALLHTICCHEQHNDSSSQSQSFKSFNDKAEQLAELSEKVSPDYGRNAESEQSARGATICCKNGSAGPCEQHSIVPLLDNNNIQNNQILMLKFVPRFLTAMPLTFLNTQHPALQLSCSVLRDSTKNYPKNSRTNATIFELGNRSTKVKQSSQTVAGDEGLLWLCMSNGYVSHISLVEFVQKDCQADGRFNNEKPSKHCYNIVPVVKTGGDICKSQINCAAQVYWSVSRPTSSGTAAKDENIENNAIAPNLNPKSSVQTDKTDSNEPDASKDQQQTVQPPEVSIKSASPPVNIEARAKSDLASGDDARAMLGRHISSSAPANSRIDFEQNKVTASKLSASTIGPIELSNRNRAEGPGKALISQNSSDGSTDCDGQRSSALRRVINHRYQPHNHHHHHHHHHHSQDQIRCRAHRCTPSLQCHGGGNVRRHHHHRAIGPSPTASTINSQPRWLLSPASSQPHHGGHHHHHHHGHQGVQHHHHHHHYHHVHNARHHTVSLGELRRALERQSKLSGEKDQLSPQDGAGFRRCQLIPPANTPNQVKLDHKHSSVDGQLTKTGRSNTPPARLVSAGTRTKQLRHQASLKTSAILAKLVSSAGKGSSYLKRSTNQSARLKSDQQRDGQSDLDDNETDTDQQSLRPMLRRGDNNSSIDSIHSIAPPLAITSSNSIQQQQSNPVVSPLSSVSSLNSSNSSSMTMNSVCVSTPMHGSYARLFDRSQWSSATCCAGPNQALSLVSQHQSSSSREDVDEAENQFSLRSRSATVPCRAYCEQSRPVVVACQAAQDAARCPTDSRRCFASDTKHGSDAYKVNDIIDDPDDQCKDASTGDAHRSGHVPDSNTCFEEQQSSLWLGCEDGSLIIIDCLASVNQSDSCDVCNDEPGQPERISPSTCQNVHSELKLGAPISDIKCYMDKIVFVALADGRLAVFSRVTNSDGTLGEWPLENPQIITVTPNELNLTSKLCLVDEDYLWYSYGRNIFVFDISTLAIKTTIMTPSNDKSIQCSMQTITIDGMEVVPQLNGVWVSFRGSPLIQFYESRAYKLLLEMSLLEPINKVLSCGNEIIRQHKTACLGATSLLSIYNESDDSNSLFIGTTAGLILVLTINRDQLREQVEAERLIWSPQVISLRHGHSGHVKFLQLVEPTREQLRPKVGGDVLVESPDNESPSGNVDIQENQRSNLILVSGGSGMDLYGPNDSQQIVQHDDSLNHVAFWAI